MCAPFQMDPSGETDETLLARARSEDRDALESLLGRHQPWIFNIALRMLYHHADAEDATQDILIKVLKALPSFRGDSKFSTWLYRIAVNHILNVKKEKWTAAEAICSFSVAAAGLQRVPDLDPPDPATVPVPVEILVEEVKASCTMGTLLCLDGRQRLVFILAVGLGLNDEAGAEIAGVTPANFRQILSRARRDLYAVPARQLQPDRTRPRMLVCPEDPSVHPGRLRRSPSVAVRAGPSPPGPGHRERPDRRVARGLHEGGRRHLPQPPLLPRARSGAETPPGPGETLSRPA